MKTSWRIAIVSALLPSCGGAPCDHISTHAGCMLLCKMNWCCMESFFSSLGVQELLLIYGGICEFLGGLRWLCVYCMSEAFLHWKPAGGWLAFVTAPRPVLVPFTIKILQTCKVSHCKSNFSVIHKKCSGAQLCKTKKWKETEMVECCSVKVQSITMKGRMCFYYGSDKLWQITSGLSATADPFGECQKTQSQVNLPGLK